MGGGGGGGVGGGGRVGGGWDTFADHRSSASGITYWICVAIENASRSSLSFVVVCVCCLLLFSEYVHLFMSTFF